MGFAKFRLVFYGWLSYNSLKFFCHLSSPGFLSSLLSTNTRRIWLRESSNGQSVEPALILLHVGPVLQFVVCPLHQSQTLLEVKRFLVSAIVVVRIAGVPVAQL